MKRRRNRHHDKHSHNAVLGPSRTENALHNAEQGQPSASPANDEHVAHILSAGQHRDRCQFVRSASSADLFDQDPTLEIAQLHADTNNSEPLSRYESEMVDPQHTTPAVCVGPLPSLGCRLREGREARGLTIEDVASRLRLQTRLIQALEADDYSRIEHAIYLKGYLVSYARLVGLPVDIVAPALTTESRPAPPLIATGKISHSRYLYERYSVPVVYLVLTGLIVGPSVWLATHGGLEQNIARLTPLDAPVVTTIAVPPSSRSASSLSIGSVGRDAGDTLSPEAEDRIATSAITSIPVPKPADQPLMASLAPFPVSIPSAVLTDSETVPAAGLHRLVLKLNEASWVEIIANDGHKLEYGLLISGTVRSYESVQPLSVRLGNASGAEVTLDGKLVDIAPYRRANVAHFRVFDASALVSAIE